MSKINSNNKNGTKLDIFPWNIFKSDVIYFLSKMLKFFIDFQIEPKQ